MVTDHFKNFIYLFNMEWKSMKWLKWMENSRKIIRAMRISLVVFPTDVAAWIYFLFFYLFISDQRILYLQMSRI
jgi:hypothetical protein